MIDLAGQAVEAALSAGGSDAEAYLSESRQREVHVHGGKVESLSTAAQRGIGVRVWIGQRAGYAFGTDLDKDGIAAIAARASDGARAADEDEFAGPAASPPSEAAVLELTDPSVEAWPLTEVVELALAVERAALQADVRVSSVDEAVYASEVERIAIVSSTGIATEFEASSCHAYASVLAEGEQGAETGLGFGIARGPQSLDAAAIGAEGARLATAMIGARKPQSRQCPVVLDPRVAASFVGLIGGVLGADAVQRGRSPFAGRLDDEVASTSLVLHDDGLHPEGPATSPVDGEGVARRRTALVEGGRLCAYLHDTYTARRGDAVSTGNAGRSGYRALPAVSPSNLVVAPGPAEFEGLLGEAGDGVYVTQVAGLHSGVNPVSGVFSVGASGRAIRGGELAEPLREFTIASDLVSMLRAVSAVGAEARWVPFGGSVSTPPLLVAAMAVSGS